MEKETVELVFPARLVYIEAAESMLTTVLSTLELDDDTGHDVRLSVHEALVNAWRHGAREDPGVSVRLQLTRFTGGVEVVITDEGVGFEPSSLQDPTTQDGMMAAQGRGIFLMRNLADRVDIESRPGGPTRVRLRKHWPERVGADGAAAEERNL